MKTVVIPCAGTGSRLGELTRNYNKAMITLGPKPVISYIIEHFTKEDEIIILLGYKGNFLRQVIKALYPDWNIKFREVDKFDGPGSGLGYSLSMAMDLLQKPFIFWPNDTLVDNDFNTLPYIGNWVMTGKRDRDSELYRHVLVSRDGNCTILPKSSTGYIDSYPYIGICYIKDYERFWKMFSKNRELFINEGEVAGINNLSYVADVPSEGWIDTGNAAELKKAQKDYSEKMEEVILEKPDEAIWFIDDRVVKFHVDCKFISNRIRRFNTFLCDEQKKNGIKIPELLYHSDNVYVYRREPGVIASKYINPETFRKLLTKFFTDCGVYCVEYKDALQIYNDFYRDKTLSRISKFLKQTNEHDDDCLINGLNCISAEKLVKKIDWEFISRKGYFNENYHGDFHLENILLQGDLNDPVFVMLDWRQDFGPGMGQVVGDVYYDLAKMWHSLIVNHQMVKDNLFSVRDYGENSYLIDIHRTFLDTEMERVLEDFIEHWCLDKTHAKLITALVFLNIAACHTYPYSRFLFYLGKYLLNKIYMEHTEIFKVEEDD